VGEIRQPVPDNDHHRLLWWLGRLSPVAAAVERTGSWVVVDTKMVDLKLITFP
jgi:hypothetical protein